jgi:hypothetical protein
MEVLGRGERACIGPAPGVVTFAKVTTFRSACGPCTLHGPQQVRGFQAVAAGRNAASDGSRMEASERPRPMP